MKKLKKLLCVLMSIAVLSGCSNGGTTNEETTSTGGETLIVRAVGDPQSFNPNITGDDNLYPIAQNMYNRLVKLDASKQIVPDLAESYTISEDGLHITFNLRTDAKWHDGEPVTSEDVKYTFDTIKENSSYYFNGRMKMVDSIDTPDEKTVVFNLNTADVSIIAELGWYATFILPEHIYNNGEKWEDNAQANANPIGSGAFKFSEYNQGQNVVLVANENYHDGAPQISRLVFSIIPDAETAVQAFLNGEIDYFENLPSARIQELQANPNIDLKLNEYPSPMRMIFNLDNEILADVNVRKAIATAINKEEISEKVFAGIQKPENNMYPSFISWVSNSEDTAPAFNIEEAISILENAGYKKDADGFYIKGLTLDVFEGSGYPESAKLIKSTLEQAGIGVDIVVSEYNAWSEKVMIRKDFMIQMQGGFMGPDPAMLYNCFGTGGSRNVGNYSNPEFDNLVAEGGKVLAEEERAPYYKDAQKILAEDLPYVPIVTFAAYDGYNNKFNNLPIQGEGKWGWAEFSYVEVVK